MKKYILIFMLIFSLQPLKGSTYSETLLLETCGALSFQGVYITFSSIGTFADAYSFGVYDDQTAVGVLWEYIELSKAVNDQLNTLLTSQILDPVDSAFILELNNIYQLLMNEAEGIMNFIQTKNESYISIYDSNRVKAWEKIAILFELEE